MNKRLTVYNGNKSVDYFILYGTTIIASLSMEEIILAADARSHMIPADGGAKVVNDNFNKINELYGNFYTLAGYNHLGNISINGFINNLYDPSKSIKENAPILQNGITNLLREYFLSISENDKKYFNSLDELNMFTVIIVGFEDSKPAVAVISIEILRVADNIYQVNPKQCFAERYEANLHETVSGGAQIYMKEYIQAGHLKNKKITPDDLIYLISLEAAHNENIGTNVNYVMINKDGHTSGKNY